VLGIVTGSGGRLRHPGGDVGIVGSMAGKSRSWADDDDEPDGDVALLQRWRGGDAAAGQRLADGYYTAVRRFFEARLPAQAEDLTQRTFLEAFEGAAKGRVGLSFRAYLFGVARRRVLMQLRTGYQRRNASVLVHDPEPLHRTSLTGVFARSQEQHFVLRAFTALPPELQMTVQLFYWEGMPVAEIAEVTEVAVSTVTSRLARARERMREVVEGLRLPRAVETSVVGNLEGWTRSLVSGGGR